MTRWKCNKCPYVYDPRVGDLDGGIPPGTPFERIPDDWVCPVCGASKRDFRPLGAQSTVAVVTPRAVTSPEPQSAPMASASVRLPLALTVGSLRGKPQG